MASHRLVMVKLDPTFVVLIGSGAFRVKSGDIPRDAKVIRAGYDLGNDQFQIVLEHESFPVVEPGTKIPVWSGPWFERVTGSNGQAY